MKKIYAFTLSGEDYPSVGFRQNLRLLTYIMYDYVYNHIGDDIIPLNVNKNIVFNNIYEDRNGYRLDSDFYDDGYINYEPFLIGDRTFGFTVLDEMIDERQIIGILQCALTTCRLNYQVTINSQAYASKDRDDERNRGKTIKTICDKIGCRFERKMSLVKKMANSDRYKRRDNCYSRHH